MNETKEAKAMQHEAAVTAFNAELNQLLKADHKMENEVALNKFLDEVENSNSYPMATLYLPETLTVSGNGENFCPSEDWIAEHGENWPEYNSFWQGE